MSRKVLVAGVGNIFLGDDGFGVEVARRLGATSLPDGVKVADFGIRGVHLAYELCDGYDTAILIDAAPRGGQPGTIYVIDPGTHGGADGQTPPQAAALLDAHGMQPDAVLGLLSMLGGQVRQVYVVGCEPNSVEERMGLSEPVERAVDEAVRAVRDLLEPVAATKKE
ncbi:MAG: hydrogenase maturation protease [Chloroflexota bacterium]|nr:hydrogenase maturation protease [Chloroflexota bacterium]